MLLRLQIHIKHRAKTFVFYNYYKYVYVDYIGTYIMGYKILALYKRHKEGRAIIISFHLRNMKRDL